MNMNAMMKECMKPHVLAHAVAGAGIALIILALVPALVGYALVLGLVLLVGAFVWDMMVNPAAKKSG